MARLPEKPSFANAKLWVEMARKRRAPALASALYLARILELWVDALGGLKGRVNITPEIYLSGWAMAGGGSSDFMTSIQATM